MNIFAFNQDTQNDTPRSDGKPHGQPFVWIDALRDEVAQDPAAWQKEMAEHIGCRIDDFHIADILNTQHPSYFDLTHDYEILIFRKLVNQHDTVTLDPAMLSTAPVAFIITASALITVREQDSQTFQAIHQRLAPMTDAQRSMRQPISSLDLMLRIINALVDKYLELRTPLTRRIDLWQNLLLQGDHRFNNWSQLLKERLALHQLDNLCEEQLDALQELRDEYLENASTASIHHDTLPRRDMMMVRLNDLMEHVTRVQNHAARLENALKSAVELHFSATAHQTNENLRFLAILSAIFAPLTLLTGIYGMNFDVIPGLHNPFGFWWMMGGMLTVTFSLLYYFRYRRLVGRGDASITSLLNKASMDEERDGPA